MSRSAAGSPALRRPPRSTGWSGTALAAGTAAARSTPRDRDLGILSHQRRPLVSLVVSPVEIGDRYETDSVLAGCCGAFDRNRYSRPAEGSTEAFHQWHW